jgi:hypothetical protein
VGDLVVGTATTDPTTDGTIVDTKRIEADDHWNNHFLKIGADASAEFLRVSNHVQSTTTLTVTPDMAVDHAVDIEYELTELFSMEDYQQFIENGILEMATYNVLANLNYTGNTIVADTWEYTIPNNFRYITHVDIAESDGTYREFSRVDLGLLSVMPDTINKLRFSENVPLPVGRAIRIRGLGEQLLPTAATFDSAEVEIDPAFLLMNGRLQIHQILSRKLQGDAGIDAGRTARALLAQVENQRDLASTEHRVPAGVLVVP